MVLTFSRKHRRHRYTAVLSLLWRSWTSCSVIVDRFMEANEQIFKVLGMCNGPLRYAS
jgi:hypothetical protein